MTIDFWTDEHVDGMIRRAVPTELFDRPIQIVEPHDLIAMKLRGGSIEDDYDISEILLGGETIRDEVIRAQVTDEEFAHFQQIKKRAIG